MQITSFFFLRIVQNQEKYFKELHNHMMGKLRTRERESDKTKIFNFRL